MSEPMAVRVEIWPVAADNAGVWLVSGDDAWRPNLPVAADSEPHAEVELTLSGYTSSDERAMLHSTSWRVEGPAVVVTYLVALKVSGPVRGRWPSALPVSLELANEVGRPPTNSPTDPPAPRHVDVLLHGLRHLAFLLETDATNRAALGPEWDTHLATLKPALATMYDTPHGAG